MKYVMWYKVAGKSHRLSSSDKDSAYNAWSLIQRQDSFKCGELLHFDKTREPLQMLVLDAVYK